MAAQAGFAPPAYVFSEGDSDGKKAMYIEAVIRGYELDLEPLTAFFISAIERAEAEEF